MTKREFFKKVIEMVDDVAMRDFANEQIKLLDDANKKRKTSPSQLRKIAENNNLKNGIVEILTERVGTQLLTSDIARKLDISTSKASALCLQLVKEGTIAEIEVKVPSVGKRKAYFCNE